MKSEPNYNPVPLLQSFESRALNAHEVTPLLFTIIDSEDHGYTLRHLNQEDMMPEAAVEIVHETLVAEDCVERPLRAGRSPHQAPWMATPKLLGIADAYNTMFADFMSERMLGDVDGQDAKRRALGRMALAYQLPVMSYDNPGDITEAARVKGMGHPLSVTHRALASFALFERMLAPVQHDISRFIRPS
jgi:hypothetical protein